MSIGTRSVPDIGDIIRLASDDRPAVWNVVAGALDRISLSIKLEHVETDEMARRGTFVVAAHI